MSPSDEHLIKQIEDRKDDPVAYKIAQRLRTMIRLDIEAAAYVEAVICMRTGFTGNPPHIGWKGLGLALTEALDERDRLREIVARYESTQNNSAV